MPYTVKDILKLEVAPALGCTEPVATALGAAAAASVLPSREIDSIEVWVDPNIYKNGLAVSIPGTGGLSGLDTAAALGGLGGDPNLNLDAVPGVRIGVIDHLVGADIVVGDDHQAVVSRPNAGRTQPDIDHIAPGTHSLDFNAITHPERLIQHDHDPANHI